MALSSNTKTIITRYVEHGFSAKQMASIFCVSYNTMLARLRTLGLRSARPSTIRPQSERDLLLCKLFLTGRTLEETGQAFGITRERVRQILVKNNITDRGLWKKPKVFKPKPLPLTFETMELRRRARFWARVDITTNPNECWTWKPSFTTDYPRHSLFLNGTYRRSYDAHRVAYILTYGMPQHWVLHRCNNNACVNPNHLYDGNALDNARDRDQAGNGPGTNPNYRRRLQSNQIPIIREMLAAGMTQGEVAKHFNIGIATICRVANGKRSNGDGNRKLSLNQIITIRTSKDRTKDIATKFGVSSNLISRVKNYRGGYATQEEQI